MYVKRCHNCQVHTNLQHLPLAKLHSLTSFWPFFIWGINIVRKITPKASNRHKYIVVTIDNFTKWVKVETYFILGAKQMAHFIKKHLICRYGIPMELIYVNALDFQGQARKLL